MLPRGPCGGGVLRGARAAAGMMRCARAPPRARSPGAGARCVRLACPRTLCGRPRISAAHHQPRCPGPLCVGVRVPAPRTSAQPIARGIAIPFSSPPCPMARRVALDVVPPTAWGDAAAGTCPTRPTSPRGSPASADRGRGHAQDRRSRACRRRCRAGATAAIVEVPSAHEGARHRVPSGGALQYRAVGDVATAYHTTGIPNIASTPA